MNSLEQLKMFARQKYTWPGCYPMFAICADGGVLSHRAVIENYRLIYRATQYPGTDELWLVTGIDVNWEDASLYCDHTGERIESAYAED